MGNIVGSVFSNDSLFGRIMTRCGIIIGANLMFILFSIPILTIGPALTALYHVMLKVLRGNTDLNPIKEFWKGFRSNFKQAFAYGFGVELLIVIGIVDVSFCKTQGGIFQGFIWAIYVVGLIVLIITAFFLPVLAAFADTIPHLIRNAIFFAVKNPVKIVLLLFVDVVPLYLTYIDVQRQPMYVFLWAVCGFGVIAMAGANILIKDFSKYLPPVDGLDGGYQEVKKTSDRKILKEMKRLDK